MPRIARTVAPGYTHHVTQRGNYQQPVFDEEDDFRQSSMVAGIRQIIRFKNLGVLSYD